MTFTGLLALGGYGRYVWPCYIAAAVILGWLTVTTIRRHRRAMQALAQLRRRRAVAP